MGKPHQGNELCADISFHFVRGSVGEQAIILRVPTQLRHSVKRATVMFIDNGGGAGTMVTTICTTRPSITEGHQ